MLADHTKKKDLCRQVLLANNTTPGLAEEHRMKFYKILKSRYGICFTLPRSFMKLTSSLLSFFFSGAKQDVSEAGICRQDFARAGGKQVKGQKYAVLLGRRRSRPCGWERRRCAAHIDGPRGGGHYHGSQRFFLGCHGWYLLLFI